MSDETSCKNLIAFAEKEFGHIDILFIAHGVGAHKFVEDIQPKDMGMFQKLMDVNFHSHTYLSHAAMNTLKRSKG